MANPELMQQYAAPTLVTVGYFAFYYLTILNVLRVKTAVAKAHRARGEPFDRYTSQDQALRAADRIQLNTLEHMPLFLALLWLDAVLVGSTRAAIAGGIYLFSRAVYPFLLGGTVGGAAPLRIAPMTYTGYVVVTFLAGDLMIAAIRALNG